MIYITYKELTHSRGSITFVIIKSIMIYITYKEMTRMFNILEFSKPFFSICDIHDLYVINMIS